MRVAWRGKLVMVGADHERSGKYFSYMKKGGAWDPRFVL